MLIASSFGTWQSLYFQGIIKIPWEKYIKNFGLYETELYKPDKKSIKKEAEEALKNAEKARRALISGK